MKIKILPKKQLGYWSIGLIAAMLIFFALGSWAVNLYEGVASGSTILADVAGRPLLALSMLASFGCGIAAFITGLITLIKDKERAILVFISTLIGLLVIFLIASEVILPH